LNSQSGGEKNQAAVRDVISFGYCNINVGQ